MTHGCLIHAAYAIFSQTHHEVAGIKARSLPRAVSQQSQSSDPRRILRERRLGDAAGWLPGARGVLPALALLHLVMPDAWRQLYSAVRTFPRLQQIARLNGPLLNTLLDMACLATVNSQMPHHR